MVGIWCKLILAWQIIGFRYTVPVVAKFGCTIQCPPDQYQYEHNLFTLCLTAPMYMLISGVVYFREAWSLLPAAMPTSTSSQMQKATAGKHVRLLSSNNGTDVRECTAVLCTVTQDEQQYVVLLMAPTPTHRLFCMFMSVLGLIVAVISLTLF